MIGGNGFRNVCSLCFLRRWHPSWALSRKSQPHENQGEGIKGRTANANALKQQWVGDSQRGPIWPKVNEQGERRDSGEVVEAMEATGRRLYFKDLKMTKGHRRSFSRGGEVFSDERFEQCALAPRAKVEITEWLRGPHWKRSNGGLD